MKHTRGKLLGAFGTYATLAAANAGELARAGAYTLRKAKLRKKAIKEGKEKKEKED